MGDGRYDQDRLVKAIDEHARERAADRHGRHCAQQRGAMINAVMLGAIAGMRPAADSGRSIRGRDPRRRQSGREQSARLPRRARGRARQHAAATAMPRNATRHCAVIGRLEREIDRRMPAAARAIVVEGVRRLAAYQDLPMRGSISTGSRRSATPTQRATGGRLLQETARHLAVRMSYEDVIRVAQAKIDPARMHAHREGRVARQGRAL